VNAGLQLSQPPKRLRNVPEASRIFPGFRPVRLADIAPGFITIGSSAHDMRAHDKLVHDKLVHDKLVRGMPENGKSARGNSMELATSSFQLLLLPAF
jgi:hypothetical protein